MSSDPLMILGCGYIGSRLARVALAAGRRVRVCARGIAKLEPLKALGAEVQYLDGGKPKQFGPAMVGMAHATVLYAIPPVTELPAGEAVRRAGQATVNAGGHRFIFLSTSGLYGMKPADDELIDESRAIALDDPGMVHLHAEESAVQALGATGLPVTTLRLGVVYGPGRGVRSRLRKGDYQLVDEGAHYISRVHVDDVVGAILAVEDRAPPGAMYLVADDKPTPQREVAEWLCGRLGLPMPRSVALYGSGGPPRTHRGRRLTNALLKAETGFVPRYPTYVEGELAIELEEKGAATAVPAPVPVPVPAPAPVPAAARAPARPAFVKHLSEIRDQGPFRYPDHTEDHPIGQDFSDEFGFQRVGIGVIRLAPGQRASLPHAHSEEDELAYVLEGTPDLWTDGHLHRLRPGDVVGWPAGTGIAHTLINDSDRDALILFAGDRKRPGDRVFYPVSPERQAQLKPERAWTDHPARELGPHDGKPRGR